MSWHKPVPEILTERGNSILNDTAIFLFKYNALSQYLKELKTWRLIYKKKTLLINYIDKIPTLHCELVLLCRNQRFITYALFANPRHCRMIFFHFIFKKIYFFEFNSKCLDQIQILFSSSLVRCYARKIKFLILLTLLTKQPFTQMKEAQFSYYKNYTSFTTTKWTKSMDTISH